MEVRCQGQLHRRSYTTNLGAMWLGRKVIIGSTVDEWMAKFPLEGVGKMHLWSISLGICHQRCINDQKLVGMVGFKFKFIYTYGMPPDIQKPCFVRVYIENFHLALFQV